MMVIVYTSIFAEGRKRKSQHDVNESESTGYAMDSMWVEEKENIFIFLNFVD